MSIRINNKNINMNNIVKVRVNGHTVYSRGDEPRTPLCMTALYDTVEISAQSGVMTEVDIQYSYDGSTWHEFFKGTAGTSEIVNLNNPGDKVYFRNKKGTLGTREDQNFKFIMDSPSGVGKIKLTGNIDSMVNYKELTPYCLARLFQGCTCVENAENLLLPKKTIPRYAYAWMFYNSGLLGKTPELPATALDEMSYCEMFRGTGITDGPSELPAETVAIYAYYAMFQDCYNISKPPIIKAKTWEQNSGYEMFLNSSLQVNENGTEGTPFLTTPDYIPPTISAFQDMFTGTAGEFTGTPTTGNTYKYY